MIADDLVQLDQLGMRGEPIGEALVQLRPDTLRQRVVGGVADQQVTEAEAVVAGELWAVGTEELTPNERGRAGRHLRLLRSESLHSAAVEELALDRASLEHAPLGLVELVEPRREQRLQRRRHLDVLCSRAMASISEMKSGLPPAACAMRPRRSSETSSRISASASSRSAARAASARPGRAAVEQLEASHAEQQERSPA